MVQLVKVFVVNKFDDFLSLIYRFKWWKERIRFVKLSFDFYMCVVV